MKEPESKRKVPSLNNSFLEDQINISHRAGNQSDLKKEQKDEKDQIKVLKEHKKPEEQKGSNLWIYLLGVIAVLFIIAFNMRKMDIF